MDSFRLDYAERVQQPGYNIVEAVPGAVLWNADLDYHRIGFEELRLINKTDAKWIVQVFGEPINHSTLNAVMRSLWDHYETQLLHDRKKRLGF